MWAMSPTATVAVVLVVVTLVDVLNSGPQNTRTPNDPAATMSLFPSPSTSAIATEVVPGRATNAGNVDWLTSVKMSNPPPEPVTGMTTSAFPSPSRSPVAMPPPGHGVGGQRRVQREGTSRGLGEDRKRVGELGAVAECDECVLATVAVDVGDADRL